MWTKWPNSIYIQQTQQSSMSAQISQRQLSQLRNQLKMLREYSQALEAENQTRNQERQILEKEIDRLSALEKQHRWSSPAPSTSSPSCNQCAVNKAQVTKLQGQVDRLQKENATLQNNYNSVSQALNKFSSTSASSSVVSVNKSVTQVTHVSETETQAKFRELSIKYDEINYENLMLKTENERLQRLNIKEMEENIKRLEGQRNGFLLKISSLEAEIRSLKSTQSSTKPNDNQLISLRQTILSKDRQLSSLRERLTSVTTLQFQLRNSKSTISAKQTELAHLKQIISKFQNDTTKVYKLQTQVRNLKYQLSARQTQLQTLTTKTSTISTTEHSRLTLMQSQLRELRTSISSRDTELQVLRGQVAEVNSLRAQVSSLQQQCRTWRQKYEQQLQRPHTSNYSTNLTTTTITQYSEQINQLNLQISRLSTEAQDKNAYILRIEDELREMTRRDEHNNIEVRRLDGIVNGYVEKIAELEEELYKLERSSHGGSGGEVVLLRQENQALIERIHDLDRRTGILQQANMSLREQLRVSIEMRSRDASRLVINNRQDDQLLGTIKVLKLQIQELRALNYRYQADIDQLRSRAPAYEQKPPSRIILNPKLIASMPTIQTSNTYGHTNKNLYVLDDSERDPVTSVITNFREAPRGRDVSRSKASGVRNGGYDDLQRKIEMLKQENKGLRKHLYQGKNP